ncbi:MAG TPA: M28 family peptidase [Planctomycetota bacterium]|nr:M28 family peptidase [Planctomycetota bacterium]
MSSLETHAGRAIGRMLFVTLLGCLVASIAGRNMPAPLAATAAPEKFSAERAQAVVAEIARAPHPTGSKDQARVRSFLLERLRSLGFAAATRRGNVDGLWLENLIVRIPGSAPTGTLVCLAHYDSVVSGPGAGDDSIGVASWLETFRALRARNWQPKNEVILLLTDGEEQGLCGARLFLADKQMPPIACAINLEAIGNGGPALLFQLGAENGACVRAFASAVDAPAGTSLGDAVYRRMPNDTDLTLFLERGIPGFNFAISSGTPAYHAPHDTPENLDPRSLQHMGECALALTEQLSQADLQALRAPDLTFLDLLGWGVVHYPRAWDPLLCALACALVLLACWRARAHPVQLLRHAIRHSAELVLGAALIALLWWIVDAGVGFLAPPLERTAGNTTSGTLLFLGIIGLAAGFELLRHRTDSSPVQVRACAIALLWSVASFAALRWLSGASYAFTWPLVLASIGLLATLRENTPRVAGWALAIGFAVSFLIGLPILHMLLQLMQIRPLVAILLTSAGIIPLVGLFSPAFERMRRDAPWAGRLLVSMGALALIASVVVARVLVWRQGALLP